MKAKPQGGGGGGDGGCWSAVQPTLQGDFQCQCVSRMYRHHLAAQRAPPPLCAPHFSSFAIRDKRVNPPPPICVVIPTICER